MILEKIKLDKKQMNIYLFFIFILGLVNSFYQIAIIKHLSIGSPLFSITLIINVIIGLTLFSLGWGAYFSKFIPAKVGRNLIVILAVSILVVLGFLLRLLPELSTAGWGNILLVILVLSIPMVLMGILIANVYRAFMVQSSQIGRLVFYHTLGFVLGQVLAYGFIKFIGANAIFLIISVLVLALLLKRKIFFIIFFVLTIVLLILPLDKQLENFRVKEMILWPNTQNTNHVYSGWSPYVKIDLFSFGDCLAGVYNYGQQWMTCSDRNKDFEIRSRLYPELSGDILLIGAGGGMGLSQFDENDKVTGVELDPTVVELMSGLFSQYNNNAYNQFKTVSADGREFLENTDQQYDYIIYEGIDYTFAAKAKNFIEVENYLYTDEGLDLALKSLKRKGALILIHTAGELPIAKALAAIDDRYFVDVRQYYTEKPIPFGGLIVTISKDIFTFNDLRDFYQSEDKIFYPLDEDLPTAQKITDNHPFLYIADYHSISGWIYGAAVLFIIIFLSLLFYNKSKRNSRIYFFLLGTALVISELFLITKLRSLFGNYLLTFIIFSLIFFSAYALGNYYFDKFKKYLFLTPVIFVISLVLAQFIPWGTDFIVKFLFTLLLLAPLAFALGIFFPLALSKIKDEELPFAYMIDSIGVALGFFLFYLVSILAGFTVAYLIALVLYIILVFLLMRLKS